MRYRVIPTLLLHKGGLVKSVQFKSYKYVGDPINAVKIFNEKEVDELVLLDIDATRENRPPKFYDIIDILSEAFMPVAYGGGITTLEQIKLLLYNGVEKVIIGTAASVHPSLLTNAAAQFGSQSIIVSVDVKKDWLGRYGVYVNNGSKKVSSDVLGYAQQMVAAGAGELLLHFIDREGTYKGYDIPLVKQISHAIDVPVIACGGAADVTDFSKAINAGASAVAAGSMFVFQRPHQAVLISYPVFKELETHLLNRV